MILALFNISEGQYFIDADELPKKGYYWND